MIVEYDSSGRITHIIKDPVPAHMADFMAGEGKSFLNLPPVPWDPELQVDPDTGEPLMAQAVDEHGEPVFTRELQEVEDPHGEGVVSTWVENPVLVPVYASNGVDYADVEIMRDYVLNGVITPRPIFDVPETISIAADGVAEATISGLPAPCLLTVDAVEHTVDGDLTIVSDMPAEYEIRLMQWPYIEKTLKVIAHAPDAE